MSRTLLTNTEEAKVLKTVFGPYNTQQFVQTSIVFGMAKKISGFTGKNKEIAFRGSAGAGVGAGVGGLPEASQHAYLKAVLTRKKSYARVDIDRETALATRDDKGAFVAFMKEYNDVAITSFNLNIERQIIANDIAGAGSLAVGEAATGMDVTVANTDEYTVPLPLTTNMFHFQVGHLVNINSETTRLKVIKVVSTATAKSVTLKGVSARLAALEAAATDAGEFSAADNIYMQGSKDAELAGIRGVLLATDGDTYKSQIIGNNFVSVNVNKAGALALTDLDDVIIDLQVKAEAPTIILASPKQYKKILALLPSQKTYNVPAREYKGQISYSALEYQSSAGPIPIRMNRFVPDSEIFFLNMNHIEFHMLDAPMWLAKQDGSVLRDREDEDAMEGRYGVYWDLFVNPQFQGILRGLT
jgi:hypothetical protein